MCIFNKFSCYNKYFVVLFFYYILRLISMVLFQSYGTEYIIHIYYVILYIMYAVHTGNFSMELLQIATHTTQMFGGIA